MTCETRSVQGGDTRRPYDAVLLDMDGTVLDTLEDLHLALNHALASQGQPPRSLEECRHFVGNGIYRLVVRGLPPEAPQELVDATFDEFNRWYKVHCTEHTHPYDGICELLSDLKDAGVRTACVSNKSDYAVQELVDRYFPGLLDFSLGVRDGLPKKPDSPMVELALKHLGVDKTRACYAGDSEVDVATATNAGMDGLICEWGFRTTDELVAAGARMLVPSVAALHELLLP